jgi:hypothetical protein
MSIQTVKVIPTSNIYSKYYNLDITHSLSDLILLIDNDSGNLSDLILLIDNDSLSSSIVDLCNSSLLSDSSIDIGEELRDNIDFNDSWIVL